MEHARRILPVLLLASAACRPAPHTTAPEAAVSVAEENPRDCVEEYDPGLDYFPDKAAPQHAEGFDVTYFRHYKVVRVVLPENLTASEAASRGTLQELTYVLRQCGTPEPDGWPDAWPGAELVDVPARTLVTTSTTIMPHLAALDLVDRLVGHDHLAWVTTPEIRHRMDAGKVVEVGNIYLGDFQVEKVLALQPDLLMSTEISDADRARLRAAGTAVVLNPEYFETTPLGRAEWLLFTAFFFNREAAAGEVLAPVRERYTELAALTRSVTPRPAVLSGGLYEGKWILPGGESAAARLISDAGADYLWADELNAGSLLLSLEDVLPQARRADVWIHPSGWRSLDEIRAADARLADLDVLRGGRVFQNDARMTGDPMAGLAVGNAYFETGFSRPDQVLADLVKIFHPDLLPAHRLVFHRQLR